jgi:hypothetical protein
MRVGILVIAAVGPGWASGCFSGRTGEIETARQAEINRVGELAASKIIRPSCSDDPQANDPPSQRRVAFGTSSIVQPCGMIVAEVLAKSNLEQFVQVVCGGNDDGGCLAKGWDMFIARLEERYVFANWTEVANKCRAHPVECKQWSSVELWALMSHNDGVSAWASDALAATNQRYQAQLEAAYQEERERRQRVGAALAAFGNALAPQPATNMNCTSNTVGTVTTTSCH